jgi:glycosyltransferase involved in cell wall biosynthesis/SAM-dependent methyltransferase
VLRVIARLNVGGPALHVAYLSAGLADRGYETTLVTGEIARGEASMESVAAERGVVTVRIPGLSREIAPHHDVAAAWRLARLMREQRPDILHTHTAKAGAVGRIAAHLAGSARPAVVVHTYHGHVLSGYFGRAGTALFRGAEAMLARGSDALVAVSPQVRDDLVRFRVAPASRFTVIRLGIDLGPRIDAVGEREATLQAIGIGPERFVVAWFGRMTAVKRVHDLVDMLVALRGLGVDACLLLVGDGTDRESLEQRAHDLGVVRHCYFLGYQTDVARWYDAADVVVLTSGNEGTPVTVIEALAARTPVVATNVGGVRDVVRDGVDGFLVPVGDAEAMAERVARIARDEGLRARLAESASERVLRRYAVGRLVDDVDRLYRALLAAGNGGAPRAPMPSPPSTPQRAMFLHRLRLAVRPLVPRSAGHRINRVVFRLVGLALSGDAVVCPCCGRSYRRFVSYSTAYCPGCGSYERQRLLCLYLDRTPELVRGADVLHIGPEPGIKRRYRHVARSWLAVDLDPNHPLIDQTMDVTRLPLPDASVDLVLCSHVLDIVSDHDVAASELCRVIRPDGAVIVQAPHRFLPEGPEAYAGRLSQGGWDFSRITLPEQSDQAACRRFGLDPIDPTFVGRRSGAEPDRPPRTTRERGQRSHRPPGGRGAGGTDEP